MCSLACYVCAGKLILYVKIIENDEHNMRWNVAQYECGEMFHNMKSVTMCPHRFNVAFCTFFSLLETNFKRAKKWNR